MTMSLIDTGIQSTISFGPRAQYLLKSEIWFCLSPDITYVHVEYLGSGYLEIQKSSPLKSFAQYKFHPAWMSSLIKTLEQISCIINKTSARIAS